LSKSIFFSTDDLIPRIDPHHNPPQRPEKFPEDFDDNLEEDCLVCGKQNGVHTSNDFFKYMLNGEKQ